MERHRVDSWLKYVCLIRQRSDAAEACRGGHVKINGQSAKPAANLKEGDVVELLIGNHYRRVVVKGVPEAQVSRELARTMYADETPKLELGPAIDVSRRRGSGRPTKKERREIEKLRR